MNDIVYSRIGKVIFSNECGKIDLSYIKEFEDYDDSIVITTEVEIDSLRRGWLGDITYFATNGFRTSSYELNEDRNRIGAPHHVNNVLLIRQGATSGDGVVEWTQQILQWNREDKDIEPLQRKVIKVFINSNGGCLNSIMHLITVLQMSITPVMTIGLGKCYSSGGLLLMCGNKGMRYIFNSTSVLIHDGGTGSSSDTGKFIDYAEYVKMTEARTKEYILANTKITEKEYDRNYRRDWWILGDDIIRLGVADKIITSLDEII